MLVAGGEVFGPRRFCVYIAEFMTHNAATMHPRYLVSIHEVNCAVPLRDTLSNLIATTEYIPGRNIYAAILTRQQWNKIRDEFWATGRQSDHGRLIPDIDFVASDGKSFLDFEACQKHEEWLLSKSQVGEAVNSPDSYSGIAGSSPAPATTAEIPCLTCKAMKTWTLCADGKQYQCPDCKTLVGVNRSAMCRAFEYEESKKWASTAKTVPDVPCMTSVELHSDRTVTANAPATLEERMLIAVGANYTSLDFLASLLKTPVKEIKAAIKSSDKFKLSATGKSICRAA